MALSAAPVGESVAALRVGVGRVTDTLRLAADEFASAGEQIRVREIGAAGSNNFVAMLNQRGLGPHVDHIAAGQAILSQLPEARIQARGSVQELMASLGDGKLRARAALDELATSLDRGIGASTDRAAADAAAFSAHPGGVKQRLEWGERAEPLHGFSTGSYIPDLARAQPGGPLRSVNDEYAPSAILAAQSLRAHASQIGERLLELDNLLS